jgi:hypothetical protein
MNTCIIGAGVTGLSLLLLLQESGADLSKIIMIDPHFDGGDLARKWTAVQSNTPWSKTLDAIKATCPSLKLPDFPDTNASSKLVEIATLLRTLATPALKKVQQIQGAAVKVNYSTEAKRWTISVTAAGKSIDVFSKKLILAQGSEPKTMDLSIPSIPLEIALDSSRLQHYTQPGQRAIVFGTMHSGTLVIRNLVANGLRVVAYYNTPHPFSWDRDGHYDGIKREAADIADDIISGKIPVELVPIQETSKVIRTSHSADWVVYAMGFHPRDTIQLSVDEIRRPILSYDGKTGALNDVPSAWGFGTAYPNAAPDGIHWDVSVAAFLRHVHSQIGALLAEV